MEITEYLADFRIAYSFMPSKARIKNPPRQGYYPNWIYAEDYSEEESHLTLSHIPTFMIVPIFVDEYGLVYDKGELLPLEGYADMMILFDEMRSEHRRRIRVGTKGYFVEGAHPVAEATVIDILYLNHDDHERKIQY
jgi:hypothetical protein